MTKYIVYLNSIKENEIKVITNKGSLLIRYLFASLVLRLPTVYHTNGNIVKVDNKQKAKKITQNN